MATRPNYIDLRTNTSETIASSASRLPSPRLHVAGDIPPALSPLDAFALQSRMLAKQLSDSENEGKRMSRLPPLAIAETLGQPRSDYIRSTPVEEHSLSPTISPQSAGGTKTEVEPAGFRPVSVHPMVGAMPPPAPKSDRHHEEQYRGRRPPIETDDYFGARRELSPTAMEREPYHPWTAARASSRPSTESLRRGAQGSRKVPDSLRIGGAGPRALAPPRSPFSQRTPSPRSMVSIESSDDEFFMSPGINALSPYRERSESAISTSTNSPSLPRSPSVSSEVSIGGSRLQRPAMNFSRPISRASAVGTPIDIPSRQPPSRQASSDSQPSFILADDTNLTPVSIHDEGLPEISNNEPVPSYVYSRFSLPRGKMLQRNSLIFQDQPSSHFEWEQPVPFSNVQRIQGAPPPSPPSRPSTSSMQSDSSHIRPSLERAVQSSEATVTSAQQYTSRLTEATADHVSHASISSGSTIKPRSLATTAELPAEEHVAKAIAFHESGALTKSTYHLRLAARQNHPTGMLLYALACRHGWGMRPNQKEGVAWLRRAVDCAGLEVADDEGMIKEGKTVDFLETKARKAQFALGIYELGVSHHNGWGIEQDKGLALRCFEIAGCKVFLICTFQPILTHLSMGRRRRPYRSRVLLRQRRRL